MMIFPGRQLFLVLIILIKLTESERKSKRTKEHRSQQAPIYDIYQSEYLPSDTQITTYLHKGEPKRFYYQSTIDNGSLSTTIMTCSSPVDWSMMLKNESKISSMNKSFGETTTTLDVTTKNFTAFRDIFVVILIAKDLDTYVHIYISTEEGGPQALRNTYMQKLRLQKRQRKKRLTIRWEASLVDPQSTDYCLTVSTKRNYETLCSAQFDRYGVISPSSTKQLLASSQTVINWQPKNTNRNSETQLYPLIACVGRKRQYTVSNLKQGQIYYFDLFAINRQSNLTYFFGSASTKFDNRFKPISLKDGKSTFANLRKFDGKVIFRFKVADPQQNPLSIFIMPCGGLVDAEVSIKGKVLYQKRIEKFNRFVINSVENGRYSIKIHSVNFNMDDVSKNSGVEVFVTSKPPSKIPLPNMPSVTKMEEHKSLRKCDSVTIAWLPSPGRKEGHYCIVAKEGKIREADDYGIPDQCRLERRLKKSVDFVKYCKNIYHNFTKSAIIEKINYLKPGKSYIVQVTVKKPKGKSLAYDLLQVHTAPSCHKY